MAVPLLKIRQLAITSSSYLSHRRLPFLRCYAMAATSQADVFQKVQIHRDDTVSHPYLIAASMPSIAPCLLHCPFLLSFPFSGIRRLRGWKREGTGDRCAAGVVGRWFWDQESRTDHRQSRPDLQSPHSRVITEYVICIITKRFSFSFHSI